MLLRLLTTLDFTLSVNAIGISRALAQHLGKGCTKGLWTGFPTSLLTRSDLVLHHLPDMPASSLNNFTFLSTGQSIIHSYCYEMAMNESAGRATEGPTERGRAVGLAVGLALAGVRTFRLAARRFGRPPMIRGTSQGISNIMSRKTPPSQNGKRFAELILQASLRKRIEELANATANRKAHGVPFTNMLFCGPPGIGKTVAARELARISGLDYAIMTGRDGALHGSQADTHMHRVFNWAKRSKNGLLLFIDDADSFLHDGKKRFMSDGQKNALDALLFHTAEQSKDIVLALATNRPTDLDSAVADRIDEVLDFPPLDEELRFKILKYYLNIYIAQAGEDASVAVAILNDELLKEAASKIDGFSGSEIANLMHSVQAKIYWSEPSDCLPSLFRETVHNKVAGRELKKKLAAKGELA